MASAAARPKVNGAATISLSLVRAGIHGSLRLVHDRPAVQETKGCGGGTSGRGWANGVAVRVIAIKKKIIQFDYT